MPDKKIFYGWYIVAASIVGIGSSFSLLAASMTGIFAESLSAEFGWTTQQVLKGTTWAGILSIFSAPAIGALSDRVGVRRVIGVSFVILVAILYSFSRMDGSLVAYLVRYSLMALLCMGTTQVVFSRVLASWFHRKLGMALGIALAGVGFGGWFWSRIIRYFIDSYGWRGAYVGMALLIGCITLPIVLLVVRDTPASKGLSVDGDDDEAARARFAIKEKQGLSLPEAARTTQYWLMIVVFLLTGLGIQGVSIGMVPLMRALGMDAQMAAATQSNMFLAVVAGRLTSGFLLDRVFGPRIAQGFLIAPIVGITALILGASGGWAVASAMCIGLALGGEADVFAYLVKRYFGIKHYSSIYGTMFSTFGIASAIAPEATAWGVANFAGGYATVLWAHVTLLLLSFLVLFFYRPYPDKIEAY